MSTTQRFDVGLSLLDRQLIGSQDQLLGNVDNAILEPVNGQLSLTTLVTGPAGLAPRFGGRTEVWMLAIWRRLRPEDNPAPLLIPMTHVADIGSAITLDDQAQHAIGDGPELERWLRHYLISRIPGATRGPDRLAGEPLAPTGRRPGPAEQAPTDGHLVSELIGATVIDAQGRHLGLVLDVCADPPHPGRHRVGPLTIRSLLYGQHRLGAEMGYTTQPDQGPWIIAAPLRAWHHDDRVAPLDHLTINWDTRTVTVTHPDRLQHPHHQAP
jgi:sporulation protein YlmC with PRC-barrel domain